MNRFLYLLIFCFTLSLQAKESIYLLIDTPLSFQNAGFFMAQKKGFYEELDLDISITYDVPTSSLELIDLQEGVYGVADASLFFEKFKWRKLELLSSILQHSPWAFVALNENINSPKDLHGKRILLAQDSIPLSLSWLLATHNITLDDLVLIKKDTLSYENIKEVKADVVVASLTKIPFLLKNKNFKVLDPYLYNIDSYGNFIFTSTKEKHDKYKRVDNFLNATLKGWQYVISNPNETIELLQKETSISLKELQYEAKKIISLVDKERIPLGTINNGRITHITQSFQKVYEEEKDKHSKRDDKINSLEVLSEEEKLFLKQHPQLVVGIDPAWAPIEFVENNTYKGIAREYLGYILEESLDIKLSFKKEIPWHKQMDNIKNKTVDLLASMAYTKEREKKMLFSQPYIHISLIVAGGMDSELIESLKDLEGKEVGVIGGNYTHKLLQNKYPKINLKTYKNARDMVIDASRGNIKYIFDILPVINYIVKNEGLNNIKLLGDAQESLSLGIAVRKDWPEFVRIINKVIQTIPKSKREEISEKWMKMYLKTDVDYSLLIKTVFGFVLLVIFFIYWNRKLQNEIEQRKVVEKELSLAQIKAESANRAKSEFLSNMSHEIRTPMNAIIGFAELTSKMDLPDRAMHNVQTIQKSAKALVTIINDVLDLSKIEAGKLSIKKEISNLSQLAEDIFSLFDLRAQQKNLFYDVSFGQNIPKAMIVDDVRIRQILINLIGNAIKFTEEGSVKVRFEVKPNKDLDSTLDLLIHVEDTGIGINKEDQEKIFGAFEQQSSQDNRKYGGTGLGLSISLKLANLMNGNIKIESKEGEGSCFTLILHHVEVASSIPTFDKKFSNVEFDEASIMIVDDIEENLKLMDKILKEYGFKTICVSSGKEAIEMAISENPSIIMMDIKMPQIDGYEASNKIRKNPKTSHIPIIAASASIFGDEHELALEKGSFETFLPKPIDIIDLEKELSKYISHIKLKSTKELEEMKKTSLASFGIFKENKDLILEYAQEVLDFGDLEKASEVLAILEKQKCDKKFIKTMKEAINNFDIDIIEKEMYRLVRMIKEEI